MLIHLVTDHFSVGGGIEHIYQIVKGLKDFNFGIFAKPGSAEQKFTNLKNVRIYNGGFQPGYVMADKPDLVHIHHLRPLSSFFKKYYDRYKIPVIFTAHGLHIHKYEFSGSLSDKLKYNLRFIFEKTILKKLMLTGKNRHVKCFVVSDRLMYLVWLYVPVNKGLPYSIPYLFILLGLEIQIVRILQIL